ncbi:MAG: response regulator transcription factor [Bacilli bacterium]|nr:response regulator transcription factor [Bacilli bacterium]
MNNYLIYSVEDDVEISHVINLTLTKQGYNVISFYDGESFLEAFAKQKPQMVLLDMMLPGIQGKDILKFIRRDRSNDNIQIIIISANRLVVDKVDGLDLGADDYIEKPFDLLELMSRVSARSRRVNKPISSITIGSYTLDLDSRSLKKNGQIIELTSSEFKIAKLLFENRGKVITRKEISYTLCGDDSMVKTKTIDMHIKSLRKKLGDTDYSFIVSLYGSGYIIN